MVVACNRCGKGFRVVGPLDDFQILREPKWSAGYPCPSPKCRGVLSDENECTSITEMSVPSFYRAIHGFGFGGSAPASPEKVMDLLTTKRIIGGDVAPIGQPARCLIRSLTLEDGTVLYLAAGNRGACVYLVEEASDVYARDRLDALRAAQDSAEDRAQVGHPADRPEAPGERVSCDAEDAESKRGPRNRTTSQVRASSDSRARSGSDGARIE